jgi:integrase
MDTTSQRHLRLLESPEQSITSPKIVDRNSQGLSESDLTGVTNNSHKQLLNIDWAILLKQFSCDWIIIGHAQKTLDIYRRYQESFLTEFPNPTLDNARQWLGRIPSADNRRYRARALRALGKWCVKQKVGQLEWWENIPLAKEIAKLQPTVSLEEFELSLTLVTSLRGLALVQVLWCTGMRKQEIAKMKIEDIMWSYNQILVNDSKNGEYRFAPIPPECKTALLKYLNGRMSGSVFQLTYNGIRSVLRGYGVKSPHAWRRGWAVNARASSVSDSSIQTAAGWKSSAMLDRYTKAYGKELAMKDFANMSEKKAFRIPIRRQIPQSWRKQSDQSRERTLIFLRAKCTEKFELDNEREVVEQTIHGRG